MKDDLETPDLWAELRREVELLGDVSNEATENTRFAPAEQTEIVARLREVDAHVRLTYSLSAEQRRILDVKINLLIDAVGRLGRTDWLGLFVGVIVSYILAVGLPPEAAHSVFRTFMTLLRETGHFFGH